MVGFFFVCRWTDRAVVASSYRFIFGSREKERGYDRPLVSVRLILPSWLRLC